jgi:esterase/lipase superfamily enzyme
VIQRVEADEIYLVAHSMGSRALTGVFPDVYAEIEPQYRDRIKEVILAAPDIDATVFKTQIAPGLQETKVPLTVYASQLDRALAFSRTVHGYPRLGDSAKNIADLAGVEAIDAGEVSTEFLNHSLFADQPTIINDLLEIFDLRRRADARSTVAPVATDPRYWRVVADRDVVE